MKQILTDCTSVSEVADLFIGNYFYEQLHEETTLCYYQKLLEDFLETCANVCLRKLLVVAKQSKNIWKGVKHSTCANSMLCLSTKVNVSSDTTHSTSNRAFGK